MVSPLTIEEESVRQDLLHDKAYMWVTTRGHSKAQQVKEEHKKKAEVSKERSHYERSLQLNTKKE